MERYFFKSFIYILAVIVVCMFSLSQLCKSNTCISNNKEEIWHSVIRAHLLWLQPPRRALKAGDHKTRGDWLCRKYQPPRQQRKYDWLCVSKCKHAHNSSWKKLSFFIKGLNLAFLMVEWFLMYFEQVLIHS